MNAFDNAHETRATVVIVFAPGPMVRLGGNIWENGVVPTLRAEAKRGDAEPHILAFDGYNQSVTEDVYRALRIGIDSGDCIAIPMNNEDQPIAYSIREDAKANNFSATEIQTARALQALQPSVQSHHAQTFIAEPTMQVRRLTPLECERLMGWPDDHTATGTNGPVSDTNRYKMCGNGVASPVAQWIGEAIMGCRPDAEPRSFMDHYLDQLEAERRSDAE